MLRKKEIQETCNLDRRVSLSDGALDDISTFLLKHNAANEEESSSSAKIPVIKPLPHRKFAHIGSGIGKFLSKSKKRTERISQDSLSKKVSFSNLDSDIFKKNSAVLRHAVRRFDDKKVIETINTKLVDLDQSNSKGITALHEAAVDGNFSCLEILVSKGADIFKVDNEGYTSLDYAVFGGNFDCASFLISKGAKTDHLKDGVQNVTINRKKLTERSSIL